MYGDLAKVLRSMTHRYIIILFASLAFISCRPGSGNKTPEAQPGSGDMVDLNRYMVRKDRERIQNYIERKNLRMTETATGLWYQIIKEGEGRPWARKTG